MYICSRCNQKFEERIERCPMDGKRVVPDLSGDIVGDRYTLRSLVGVGGMGGSVWSAWQASTRRHVAVKILPPTGSVPAERFARGARIASNLNHPNITTVHDYGQTALGDLYLVMELLEGRDLFQIARREDIPFPRMVHIFEQVLRALGHAHQRNVVHRDVKLSNLFITPKDDDPDFVKVLDFGIARYIVGGGMSGEDQQDEVTGVHQLCGTPQYMAPEQIGFGTIDARADLYALGVAVFRLMTGEFPFKGTSHELFRQHLQTPPPSILEHVDAGSIPTGFNDWLMTSLAKNPNDRFDSAAEMRTALMHLVDENEPYVLLDEDVKLVESIEVLDAPETEPTPQAAAIGPTSSIILDVPPLRKNRSYSLLVGTTLASILVGLFVAWDPIQSSVDPSSRGGLPTDGNQALRHIQNEHEGNQIKVIEDKDAATTPLIQENVITSQEGSKGPPDVGVNPSSPPNSDLSAARQWVRIMSNPRGASVSWGDKRLGRTPLSFPLPIGGHTFVLKKAGYHSLEKNIHVDTIVDQEHQYRWSLKKRVSSQTKQKRNTRMSEPAPKAESPKIPSPAVLHVSEPEVPKSGLRVHILGEDGETDNLDSQNQPERQRPRVEILE